MEISRRGGCGTDDTQGDTRCCGYWRGIKEMIEPIQQSHLKDYWRPVWVEKWTSVSSSMVSGQGRVLQVHYLVWGCWRGSTDKVVDPEKHKTGCQGGRNCGSIWGRLKGYRSSFNGYYGDGGEIHSGGGGKAKCFGNKPSGWFLTLTE